MNASLSAQFNYSTVFWAPFICHVGISTFETSLLSQAFLNASVEKALLSFQTATLIMTQLSTWDARIMRFHELSHWSCGRADDHSSRRSRDVIFKLRSTVQIHRARHQTGFRQPAVILPHLTVQRGKCYLPLYAVNDIVHGRLSMLAKTGRKVLVKAAF